MTAIRGTQAAVISVQAPAPPPIRATQAGIISVQSPPNTPTNITQAAVIIVTSNGVKSLALGQSIKLGCWQPCTAFGTFSTIYYLGG